MTTVTLEHVSKQYSDPAQNNRVIQAVRDVSLKLHAGESLALLGPSGCGKSTLLRLAAGLLTPDSGRVLYDNVDLREIPSEIRGIGMVFQEGALIPHWRAEENVGFFLRLRQRQREIPEKVRRISKITGIGLEALMDRFPRHLSGGERQRVGIARALARDLQVLLLDEPFANLDAKFRSEARVELKRLLQEFPVTTLYVTHDQHEATSLGRRIAVMREGHLEQVGAYADLISGPVNMFVAGFIGTPSINFFRGAVRAGHWYGDTFGGYPIRSDLEDDTQITMGVRPEAVFLKADGAPAVVSDVIRHYAERFQLVEVWLGKERWRLSLPLEEKIVLGSTIYCEIDPDAVLYFDTKTGKRIG